MKSTVKVAIIEDDIVLVQMYRRKFELEGFQVETAGDGQAGLLLIEHFRPQVVLLDLMMPTMDGETMLKELRQKPYAKQIKVVVLTNKGNYSQEMVKALKVDDFIIKADATPEQLAEKIKALAASNT